MEDLKKAFDEHLRQDREDFRLINKKLDQLLGQWKLVGAVVGVLAGIVAGIIF